MKRPCYTINAEGDAWHGCQVTAIERAADGRYACAPTEAVIDALRADDNREVETRLYAGTQIV